MTNPAATLDAGHLARLNQLPHAVALVAQRVTGPAGHILVTALHELCELRAMPVRTAEILATQRSQLLMLRGRVNGHAEAAYYRDEVSKAEFDTLYAFAWIEKA